MRFYLVNKEKIIINFELIAYSSARTNPRTTNVHGAVQSSLAASKLARRWRHILHLAVKRVVVDWAVVEGHNATVNVLHAQRVLDPVRVIAV
jgi:hypothetical protein